jgi:uncharacterized protein (TIGR02466 family)
MTEQRQQGAQVEVLQLFATPVAVVVLPEAATLNATLRQTILDRAAGHAGTEHSNLGGWQSTWDLLDWGGAETQTVVGHAKQLANRLTADRQGRPVRLDWRVNAWANVNRSGHGNEFHTHPGAYWSGTYYVDDGGIAENPELGGQFEVQDPRGVAPVMYAPNLTFATQGGASLGASETLSPRAGMMVLFPAWLQHQVRPYSGERARISIAFNLSLPKEQ